MLHNTHAWGVGPVPAGPDSLTRLICPLLSVLVQSGCTVSSIWVALGDMFHCFTRHHISGLSFILLLYFPLRPDVLYHPYLLYSCLCRAMFSVFSEGHLGCLQFALVETHVEIKIKEINFLCGRGARAILPSMNTASGKDVTHSIKVGLSHVRMVDGLNVVMKSPYSVLPHILLRTYARYTVVVYYCTYL